MGTLILFCTRKWERFWFEAECGPQIRLFSRIFALLFFFFVLSRTPDLRLMYGESGLLSVSVLKGFAETHYRFSVLTIFDSLRTAWIFHIVLLLSLGMIALGRFPRFAALLAFLTQVSFLNRDMIATYGVDSIGTCCLLYLCFADLRPEEAKRAGDWQSILGSAAYRMLQLQICIIYAYSGLDKVRGATWWRGDGLWYAISNFQYATGDFSWIAHHPVLLAAATYSTLIWEVYFPALVWVKPLRYPVLIFGVFLHVGIAVVMGLKSFGFLMIAVYALFLRPQDAEKIAHCVKKVLTPRKVFLRKADQLGV